MRRRIPCLRLPAPATAPVVKNVETPLEALCWALLSSNEFLFLN